MGRSKLKANSNSFREEKGTHLVGRKKEEENHLSLVEGKGGGEGKTRKEKEGKIHGIPQFVTR